MNDDYKIATADLFLGQHRAYTRGDKVFDLDAIEKWGWKEQVASPNTKTAPEAQELPEPEKNETATSASEKGK